MVLSMQSLSVKAKSGRTTIAIKTPLLHKAVKKTMTKKINAKMTIGRRTSTSKKFDVRICGDGDVADVYHHMETEMPDSMVFMIFGEAEKSYGFKSGRVGEYFSVKFIKGGGFAIKGRVDWEDGIDMVGKKHYIVWHVKNEDLVQIPGYTYENIRI